MLEYLMQNATLTIIIIILLILNWAYFFAHEDKKKRIESLNEHINRIEYNLLHTQYANQDLRAEKYLIQGSLGQRELEIKALRKQLDQMEHEKFTEKVDPQKLLKINSVIMYNTLKYIVVDALYKRKGPTHHTIHMVYTLLGEDGSTIEIPHSQIIEEGYAYVFKTK